MLNFEHKKEGVTKRSKRAWWKQKSERIAEQRFGGFRTSIQLVYFGTRLCEDNKEVATFMSQPLFFYRC